MFRRNGVLLAALAAAAAFSTYALIQSGPAPAKVVGASARVGVFHGTSIGRFDLNQSARGAVTQVPDPARSGETVFKMTVNNDDVAPITPTENPRAALLTPTMLHPGDDFWWRAKFLLPKDGFPSRVPQWLTLLEGPYGPPFYGTPSFHIEVTGKQIQWGRNSNYDWDVPWQMPLKRGKWIHFLMHIGFSSNGFVQMWVDGHRVTFFRGNTYNPNHHGRTRTLHMEVLDNSNGGGSNFAAIMSYRKHNTFDSVTLFQGRTDIGPTYRSLGR